MQDKNREHSHTSFIHLHLHTSYSLLQGAIHIKSLPDLCKRNNMPAVAITDSSNMFGALECAQILAKSGIQPIIGCNLDIDFSLFSRPMRDNSPRAFYAPCILLAQSERGYANLVKLVSFAYHKQSAELRGVVNFDWFSEWSEDIIALSGGQMGVSGQLWQRQQSKEAADWILAMANHFPNRFYIELQRLGRFGEKEYEDFLCDLANRQGLPLVATNHVMFPDRNFHQAHDALNCIASGRYLAETQRFRYQKEQYFKSAQQMQALFSDIPEALESTIDIARRCCYHPQTSNPTLPKFSSGDEKDEDMLLQTQARSGLTERLKRQNITATEIKKEYYDRLEYELNIIIKMKFSGYFLIVSDFIRWAKQKKIPVGPGRGSGAGSVVAWSLLITDLDPIRFGLLFERFLNPERVSMPDFDIDFCQERRDEVIAYVQERYGADHVAQIITFGKLQARAVTRDVGRVLQMPYGQVDRICKMIPQNPANPVTIRQALEQEESLQIAQREDDNVSLMMDIAMQLEGLYRHASTHAAGVVIGEQPLYEKVPIYRDPKSNILVTQFSMKWVEAAGLVKFDFLGLKTLTVIQHCLDLLEKRGVSIDIQELPFDDALTYELLASGQAVGIFQMESSGMRDVLKKMQPDCIEDLIALVSLYRPGPMDNIPKYIRCKNSQEEPDYLHPLLEPILKETYGVIIYQEQVMEIARSLSGYSLGEADLLRRAMGKKIKEEMDIQRERFVQGAIANNVSANRAEFIFDLVARFAGYGFNKSHAAAYALIAYQTAYLKAHYPCEFMSSLMTLDITNSDRIAYYKNELERMGLKLLPPCVNRSVADFTPDDNSPNTILYALGAVRNVGLNAMRLVVENRNQHGDFLSLQDFFKRLGLECYNKRSLENMIRAGAFDCFAISRASFIEGLDDVLQQVRREQEQARQASMQPGLFSEQGVADLSNQSSFILPPIPDWSDVQKLREEFAALGFYLSGHPLQFYSETLQARYVKSYQDVVLPLREEHASMKRCWIAGVLLAKKERRSARGSRYAFIQLSDQSAIYELTLFEDRLESCREFLETGKCLLFHVEASLYEGQERIRVLQVESMDMVITGDIEGIVINIEEDAILPRLQSFLQENKQGQQFIRLRVCIENDYWALLELPNKVQICTEFLENICKIFGTQAVFPIKRLAAL